MKMTTLKKTIPGLLCLALFCLCVCGCEKKAERTLPHRQDATDDIQHSPEKSEPQAALPPTVDDTPSVEAVVIPLQQHVKMRFEPLRRPSPLVKLAEQERTNAGFRPDDDFTIEDAIRTGERLRKEWPQLPPLDERALRSQNIRVIKGKHLTLCTDLPPSPEIDRLPEIFDLAVTEYCRFFGVDPKYCDAWHMRGCLLGDVEKFRTAGLLGPFPTHLPGFSVDDRLWVLEQKSDYFRRHLLLHEGVHGFMNYVFGTCGPVWYMESAAEYLGTHRWENGRLELGVMPENADAAPGWQRIELVRRDIKAGHLKTVDRVMGFSGLQLETPTDYAWVWAFGFLLDRHPQYRDIYRDMARWLTFTDFSNRFYLRLADHWGELQVDWLCLLDELCYGYDMPRMVMERRPCEPLKASAEIEVDASRGWQSSGVTLEAGQTCHITASGRYRLGDSPKVWYAEPNGVTLRYHLGQPVGLLLGAVVPEKLFETDEDMTPDMVPFLTPLTIGPDFELTPEHAGTLYLRVNDSPAELRDNQGQCHVDIKANP